MSQRTVAAKRDIKGIGNLISALIFPNASAVPEDISYVHRYIHTPMYTGAVTRDIKGNVTGSFISAESFPGFKENLFSFIHL